MLLGDAEVYDAWAREIAAGNWLGDRVFYQAPLYPYFLAVIYAVAGHSLDIVRLVQIVLGSFSCVLMGLAAARFFSRRAGLLTTALMALCPALIFFDGLVQKAVLDVFCFTLMWWLAARAEEGWRGWVLLGAAAGLLALTRENALILLPVLMLWAWRSRSLKHVAWLLAGTGAVLLPVAGRNAHVGGGFHLTTSQMGPNFYIGNNPQATGSYQPLRAFRGHARHEREDATELAEQEAGRKLSAGEVSDFWLGKSWAFIQAEPWRWTKLTLWKMALVWNATELGDTEEQAAYAEHSWLLRALSAVLHFGVLCPLGLMGMCWLRGRWVLVASALIYAASVAAFFVFARYRLLLYPLVIAYAAAALAQLPERCRRPVLRSTWVGLLVVLLSAFAVNWRPALNALEGVMTWQNLGNEWLVRGDFRKSLAWYERVLALHPKSAEAHAGKGMALGKLGAQDAAVEALNTALVLDASVPDAETHLGNALLAKGQAAEALPHFQRAVQQQPKDAVVYYNLGNALLQLGRVSEAMSEYERAVALDPKLAEAHNNLGSLLFQMGRTDEAFPHFQRYAELAPEAIGGHANLGLVLRLRKDYAGAAREYERALALDAGHVPTLGNLSWLLATCAETSIRDGARAVELATKAVALTNQRQPMMLRSLAAALAETGKFAEALRTIESAIQLLTEAPMVELLKRERDAYARQEPWRE